MYSQGISERSAFWSHQHPAPYWIQRGLQAINKIGVLFRTFELHIPFLRSLDSQSELKGSPWGLLSQAGRDFTLLN